MNRKMVKMIAWTTVIAFLVTSLGLIGYTIWNN